MIESELFRSTLSTQIRNSFDLGIQKTGESFIYFIKQSAHIARSHSQVMRDKKMLDFVGHGQDNARHSRSSLHKLAYIVHMGAGVVPNIFRNRVRSIRSSDKSNLYFYKNKQNQQMKSGTQIQVTKNTNNLNPHGQPQNMANYKRTQMHI